MSCGFCKRPIVLSYHYFHSLGQCTRYSRRSTWWHLENRFTFPKKIVNKWHQYFLIVSPQFNLKEFGDLINKLFLKCKARTMCYWSNQSDWSSQWSDRIRTAIVQSILGLNLDSTENFARRSSHALSTWSVLWSISFFTRLPILEYFPWWYGNASSPHRLHSLPFSIIWSSYFTCLRSMMSVPRTSVKQDSYRS